MPFVIDGDVSLLSEFLLLHGWAVIHVSRIFPMIHAGRMCLSPFLIILVATENAPGRNEQDTGEQYCQ